MRLNDLNPGTPASFESLPRHIFSKSISLPGSILNRFIAIYILPPLKKWEPSYPRHKPKTIEVLAKEFFPLTMYFVIKLVPVVLIPSPNLPYYR